MSFSDCIIHRKFNQQIEYEITFFDNRLCYTIYSNLNTLDLRTYINRIYSIFEVFELVVIIETGSCDVEYIRNIYPDITIIELIDKMSKGRMIDLVSSIISSRFFYFTDTSQNIISFDFNNILKIFESYKNPLVVSPVFVSSDNDCFFNIRVPTIKYMSIICDVLYPFFKLQDTLYPLSYIGIYDKKKYIDAGGFDLNIKDEYYCLLEFSIRFWLLGYSAICYKNFISECESFDLLKENIKINTYRDIVNFRIQYLYRRPNEQFRVDILYFLFRAVDKNFRKSKAKKFFFLIDFKTLLKRWQIEEIEEVL